jgi:hypothetical protein
VAEQVVVSLFPCSFSGGVRRVPVGSKVVVKLGWEAKEKGLVQSFLKAQTTTVAVGGAAPVDISDSYGPIEPAPNGNFRSHVHFDTGVTLGDGDALQVDGVMALSHLVADGLTLADEDTHRPQFFGPGTPFTLGCRITAS